jgi:hypothetical protein
MMLLCPLELPMKPGLLIRSFDEETGVSISQCVEVGDMKARLEAECHVLRQLESVVWAMKKYDIPPSWQTAYYVACGEWPPNEEW